MAHETIKEFKHIRLEPAENGWVLTYTEVRSPGSGRTFDDNEWSDKTVVFADGDEDAAFSKMKELHMFNKTAKGGQASSAPVMTVEAPKKSIG